jgi:SAM-dependent methyltransferase
MRRAAAGLLVALAALPCAAWAQDEVPFITTPDKVTLAMLELAAVDLGSGDGRIVITAARRFGARGLGVEIVPDLVVQSRANASKAGVADRTEFRVQDLFTLDLAAFSVVTMYLLPDVNLQLRPRILALPAGTRVVSHDWDMGDWAPDRTVTLDVPDKSIGREKKSRVHLWVVPAQVQGLWCTDGGSLHITQRFQQFSATLQARGAAAPALVFDGRVQTRTLLAAGPAGESRARLQLDGPRLQLQQVDRAAAAFENKAFVRAGAAGCA